MRILSTLLHTYSYLFHLILALFLAGMAAVALLTGAPNFQLDMLPGSGSTLINYLLLTSLFGLLAILLAVTGKVRWLYPIYGLAVFVMTVRGFFFTSYMFEGADQFKTVLWFTLGALVAMLGSISQLKRSGSKRVF